MLLIDHRLKRITLIRPESAQAPLVPLPRGMTEEGARHLLVRAAATDTFLHRVLRDELGQDMHSPRGMDHARLLDAVAHGIARRSIHVASLLQGTPVLSFEAGNPAGDPFGSVRFSSLRVAAAFAAALLADRPASSVIHRAWAYNPVNAGQSPTADHTGTVQEIASAFAEHRFLLRSAGSSNAIFLLQWRGNSAAAAGAVPSAAPPRHIQAPPPPRRIPHAPVGPRSVLPPRQPKSSPQVKALVAAARAGVPFCEECAARRSGHG